ncbi:PHD finger protein 23 [Fukomys damarensis]|uniref:PHD finger protein 23 n=1 Tax=Fukomys damarensis TaxID=885580 RepID=A0A091CPD3_FUKDA|nr:PHD finger protein 23 [Fukomys damarensis]
MKLKHSLIWMGPKWCLHYPPTLLTHTSGPPAALIPVPLSKGTSPSLERSTERSWDRGMGLALECFSASASSWGWGKEVSYQEEQEGEVEKGRCTLKEPLPQTVKAKSKGTETSQDGVASSSEGEIRVMDEDIMVESGDDSWDLIACYRRKPFAGHLMIECSLCATSPVLRLGRPMSLTSFIARNARNCSQSPSG